LDVVIDVADASIFPASGSLVALADAVPTAPPQLVSVADVSNLRPGVAVISDDTGASEAIIIAAIDTANNLLALAAPLGATYLITDAAAVSMAGAYIWDDAPNAEAVVIIAIDETLNQLTIAAPGLVAGYTVAANAAISMSPTILDGVEFVLMPPSTTTGGIGSKVQLTDWVDDGEIYPDGSMPIAPAKTRLAPFDDLANVAAVVDAALVGLNTDHRGEGANSTEWNKLGTGLLGGLAYTPDEPIDISKYSTHAKVMAFMYIPTPVGDIENLYIALGTDAANLFYWEIPLEDIVYDEWHHYHRIMSEIDGVAGVGADLSAIQHVGIYIQTALAAGTVTGILVDEVIVKRSFEVLINQLEGKPPSVQDTGLNTNPEKYLHDNHWNTAADVPIAAAGAAGEQALGAAVGADVVRRIKEVTARHTGTANTVISILDVTAGNVIISFDVSAQSTRTWSSQDGRAVAATLQPVVQTSDITGGGAIVSAAGVEA